MSAGRVLRGDWDSEVRGLSKWISQQRTLFKKGLLKSSKIEKLQQLSHWTWDPYKDDWLINYNKFCLYVQENDDPNPAPALVWRGWKIGSWINSQRQQYKTGLLPQDRIDHLESHSGFIWEPEKYFVIE